MKTRPRRSRATWSSRCAATPPWPTWILGVALAREPGWTLEDLLRERLGSRLEEGRGITAGGVKLKVRRMADGRVEQVGLVIVAEPPGD